MLPDKNYNRRIKPPWYVQVILAFYGFLWLNMIFIVGLNSLRLGYIDYDSGSIFVALTLGLKLIFWYMDRFYEVQEDDAADETDEQHESK
ncbi:MAG: hypothetical protein UHM56_08745 [Phascolarctobacterium sp.]|nr:hypothetical protein [Phascolarctobacterium sp.]